MENKIWLDPEEGVIVEEYHGIQTAKTVRSANAVVRTLALKLRAEGKPVLRLMNTTDVPGEDAAARQAALEELRNVPFDRLAGYGQSMVLRYVMSFIVKFAGMEPKIRFFHTREEALAWLKSKKESF